MRGLWLTGSLGRGDGDGLSDIDTLYAIDEASFEEFVAGWPTTASRLGDLVLCKALFPGASIFTMVTRDWVRWDAVLATAAEVTERLALDPAVEIINHDEIVAPPPRLRAPPSPERLQSLVQEFLRIQGLLPVVLGRGELVAATAGCGLLLHHLTTLLRLLQEGEPPTGALHLSKVLSTDELGALEALPPMVADRAAVIEFHRAVWTMFVPVAREACGDRYPWDLEQACADHLSRTIGVPWPAD